MLCLVVAPLLYNNVLLYDCISRGCAVPGLNATVCFLWFTKHDDVIKWNHFPRYWPFVRGIHRSPVNSPHKGQWRGALMFTLICARINGWVNNREAGDLRPNRAHYGVIVMVSCSMINSLILGCFWPLVFVLNNIVILGIWRFAISHLPGCFCPWTLFQNKGFNMVPSDPFMSHLATQLGYSAGKFQVLQLIVLAAFVVVD